MDSMDFMDGMDMKKILVILLVGLMGAGCSVTKGKFVERITSPENEVTETKINSITVSGPGSKSKGASGLDYSGENWTLRWKSDGSGEGGTTIQDCSDRTGEILVKVAPILAPVLQKWAESYGLSGGSQPGAASKEESLLKELNAALESLAALRSKRESNPETGGK
jgi:hypothetical protein